MTLVTADTNLLASGVARRNPATAPAQFLDAWRDGRFDLVLSEHILGELARTLSLPYFRRYVSPTDADAFVALLRTDAVVVPLTVAVEGVATHPEDDLVLATSLSGRVDYLVTGDSKLQGLGAYQGVILVTPRDFILLLDRIQ
jgi:putative PIN family toxin of toxin-antitoxin system